MSEKREIKFPNGFLWGAATASYQVEGGIENNDWAKAAREGRVPPAGRLADHYNRYEEDFDIAKSLGHNAHRFSIEWARIEPEEGKFDEQEIEHYRQVLMALKKRNIEPFITLWHFTLPLWFSESGGFERKDAPKKFTRYCTFVVSRLSDLCSHFSTINEPVVWASMGYLRGAWPPFKRFSIVNIMPHLRREKKQSEATADTSFRYLWTYNRVFKSLLRANETAYKEIKKVSPGATVSIVKHIHIFDANWNPINKLRALLTDHAFNRRFLKRAAPYTDQIDVNFYRYTKFGDRTNYPKNDMGWNINPERMYDALTLASEYDRPLLVSEAGIADARDRYRAEYITKQVGAVGRALADGIDVRGHCYWSLLDNYEWADGTDKRFGLVEIDYETLERKIRPSAYVYKKIIENNGIVE